MAIGMARIVVLLAAGALASCGQPQSTTSAGAPGLVPLVPASPSKHWVQDERLRQIMAVLNKRNPDWPRDIPQEPEGTQSPGAGQQFDEVAALAGSLAVASEHIPDLAATLKMEEADRRGFIAEAKTLHDQAEQLRAAAGQRRIESMQRLMNGINFTCLSCHSRYRDFSGQLGSPRA